MCIFTNRFYTVNPDTKSRLPELLAGDNLQIATWWLCFEINSILYVSSPQVHSKAIRTEETTNNSWLHCIISNAEEKTSSDNLKAMSSTVL